MTWQLSDNSQTVKNLHDLGERVEIDDLPNSARYVTVCVDDAGLRPLFIAHKKAIYTNKISECLEKNEMEAPTALAVVLAHNGQVIEFATFQHTENK